MFLHEQPSMSIGRSTGLTQYEPGELLNWSHGKEKAVVGGRGSLSGLPRGFAHTHHWVHISPHILVLVAVPTCNIYATVRSGLTSVGTSLESVEGAMR
jgi:hypothetical protein